jgi:hypothetical protein
MAGTLVITTLSDGTNSTSATNCIQGSAKAWVNFNGTGTVAIRGSFNVSSITDNGTGDYTVNFTTAMPNTNYVAVGNVTGGKFLGMDVLLVGSVQMSARDVANAPSDQPNVLVAVFSS